MPSINVSPKEDKRNGGFLTLQALENLRDFESLPGPHLSLPPSWWITDFLTGPGRIGLNVVVVVVVVVVFGYLG